MVNTVVSVGLPIDENMIIRKNTLMPENLTGDEKRICIVTGIQGDYIPHVRMIETGYQSPSLANLFGLQYVVIRKPKPFDTDNFKL